MFVNAINYPPSLKIGSKLILSTRGLFEQDSENDSFVKL